VFIVMYMMYVLLCVCHLFTGVGAFMGGGWWCECFATFVGHVWWSWERQTICIWQVCKNG